jgi:hypothetical protein
MTEQGEPGGRPTEVRFQHRFTCDGCGADVYASVHTGAATICHLCQTLGPALSRHIQAMQCRAMAQNDDAAGLAPAPPLDAAAAMQSARARNAKRLH